MLRFGCTGTVFRDTNKLFGRLFLFMAPLSITQISPYHYDNHSRDYLPIVAHIINRSHPIENFISQPRELPSIIIPFKIYKNKKVLLCERKRHTTRRAATNCCL